MLPCYCDSYGELNEAEYHRARKSPLRLLAFFCAIMFLVWFDNGLFASNGVTGCSKDCDDPVGFPTAQVLHCCLNLTQAQALPAAAIALLAQHVRYGRLQK